MFLSLSLKSINKNLKKKKNLDFSQTCPYQFSISFNWHHHLPWRSSHKSHSHSCYRPCSVSPSQSDALSAPISSLLRVLKIQFSISVSAVLIWAISHTVQAATASTTKFHEGGCCVSIFITQNTSLVCHWDSNSLYHVFGQKEKKTKKVKYTSC